MVELSGSANVVGDLRPRGSDSSGYGPAAPLRILHVLAPNAVGGPESVVRALAAGQARAGHAVHVAAIVPSDDPEHPFLMSLGEAGVEFTALTLPSRSYYRERTELARVCEAIAPSVVHTHGPRCDVVDAPVARRQGIPTVTTVHGFLGGDWKDRAYEHLQRRAFSRFGAVIAVSKSLSEAVAADGVDKRRVHLVPNVFDDSAYQLVHGRIARRRLGVPAHGFRIGWVGRLTAEKGAEVFIESLALLTDIPFSVSIIGHGPEQASLAARAARLGVAEHITWHGEMPNAGALLGAVDVLVLSSHTEGTPIVLLEAMAAGVPIVATSVGGVPELLSQRDAYLVPPSAPMALAEAVRSVYEVPAGAAQRARVARDRLRRDFGITSWLATHERIYRSLVGAAAAR